MIPGGFIGRSRFAVVRSVDDAVSIKIRRYFADFCLCDRRSIGCVEIAMIDRRKPESNKGAKKYYKV